MDEQMKILLAAIADVKSSTNAAIESTNAAIADGKESTNAAIADVKGSTSAAIAAIESTNAAIADVKESTNAAIAEVKESVDAAVSEIKESTMAEIAKVSAEVKDVRDSTNAALADIKGSTTAAIRELEERILQLEAKGVPKVEEETNAASLSPSVIPSPFSSSAIPAATAMPTVKASIFDGKTAWNVYKTQFDMVAAANGWNDVAKAYHLAASLRGEAADVLLTVPEHKRADLAALTTALELRFGDHHLKDYTRAQLKSRRQKSGETLQELASEIERLSLLAFPDCTADVRDSLAFDYFVDAIRDPDIQTGVRLSASKDIRSALVLAMKIEAAHLASGRDRRPVRAVAAQDNTELLEKRFRELERLIKSQNQDRRRNAEAKITCWSCRKEGHLRRNCPERDGASTEDAPLN